MVTSTPVASFEASPPSPEAPERFACQPAVRGARARIKFEVTTQFGARNMPGVAVEQIYPLLAASPRMINAVFDHIEGRYGGVESYLRQRVGLTDETLARMRGMLLV